MKRFILSFAVVGILLSPVHAGPRAGLVACEPFVNGDGTQVLETFAVSKEMCAFGHATALIRITDFKENVICSYRGQKCLQLEEIGADKELLAHYRAMQQVFFHGKRTNDSACNPHTDGKTFRTELISNRWSECGANISTVRHYDFLMKTVSFMDGTGKVIGTVPLSPLRVEVLLALSREFVSN